MTGYSRAARQGPKGTVTVEARSTNHRYLEVEQRLPDGLSALEAAIVQALRRRVGRGRVEISVSVHSGAGSHRRVVLDEALAQLYHERLLEMKSRFGLSDRVSIGHLLALPHVLGVKDDRAQQTLAWDDIRAAVEAGIDGLLASRRSEGRRLVNDIRAQIALIRKAITRIQARLPKSIAQQRQRLQERIKTLVGGAGKLTTAQLREALAVIKDTDIHEELVRLSSHLTQMDETLASGQSVGKKLDFIAQELMREANTTGSKANDPELVEAVIDIKGAIEKIREQAQNLQ
jgi:uncharacterized protein (TIGR00255 family)